MADMQLAVSERSPSYCSTNSVTISPSAIPTAATLGRFRSPTRSGSSSRTGRSTSSRTAMSGSEGLTSFTIR